MTLLTLILVSAALYGLIRATDAVDRHWATRRKPKPVRPAAYTGSWRGVLPGCCKDCGMDDLLLDYYRRDPYCAELCELKGGIRSTPKIAFRGELIDETQTWKLYSYVA